MIRGEAVTVTIRPAKARRPSENVWEYYYKGHSWHVQRMCFFYGDSLFDVSFRFMMRRPLHHFTNNSRTDGRIKATTQDETTTLKKKDIDNMIKFCMDAMIGVVYRDDSNIASLNSTKELDSKDKCLGRTVIQVVLHS